MTKKAVPGLISAMDEAARELLKSVNSPTMESLPSGEEPQPGVPKEPIVLKDRVAAFQAVTAYLAVKHKIEPEGPKSSGIDRYRSALNGGAPGRRGRSPGGTEASSGPTDDET